jgi:drug/metabolite transporter (DMT)-like permease
MVASVSWSIGSLYSQSVPRRLPLFSAAAVEMIAGAAVLFLESRLVGEDLGRFAAASTTAWTAMLYLGVFGSLVGFTAFAFCLNELPASIVGTYAYVNPVVAVLLGSLFLGEPVSAGLLAGAVLILGAVLLTTSKRHAPRPAREAPGPVPSEATTS